MATEKVIFDMDGLIFDSERIFMRELTEVMAEHGYTMTRERYIKTLGVAGDMLRGIMQEMYGDDYPIEKISDITRGRLARLALNGELPVKPGIRELLDFLKDHAISCVVASSTRSEYVEQYLEAAGLRQYFDTVIGGEMTARSKPEPDIFLKALGETLPKNAFVLEDSENGIKAGYRAGIRVICIPDMVYPSDETKALVSYIIKNAAEAVEIIRRTL